MIPREKQFQVQAGPSLRFSRSKSQTNQTTLKTTKPKHRKVFKFNPETIEEMQRRSQADR